MTAVRTLADIEKDRTKLRATKLRIDEELIELKARFTDAQRQRRPFDEIQRMEDQIRKVGRHSQRLQARLADLNGEAKLAHLQATSHAPTFSTSARNAVLFKVASAAYDYLYDEHEDEEKLADKLENALDELTGLAPNWRRGA